MMLRLEGLKKAYGNYHALDGLDLRVERGALYGLIGPNGAGKTTTIKILAGLLRPDAGAVEIDGVDALANARRVRGLIGYVPDYFGVYDNLKVSEYMEFFAACCGLDGLKARKRNQALLEQVGLGDKNEFFVDGLSKGMKQRLCLARALIHDPQLLIMDEPTAGLDPRTRLEFRELVRDLIDQGKTVLISSHLLSDLAELCTDIGIIDQGKLILHGSIEEITSRINTSKPLIITIQDGMQTAMGLLKEHPLVQTIMIREREVMVGFTGNVEAECRLLADLVEAGVAVRGFMREPGNLEAVFMQLTSHEEERVVLSYEDESGL